MLTDHAPIPTLAVGDVARAREFYEGTLGLVPGEEVAGGVFYTAGSGGFLVYPSSFAGTNKATAMSFQVPADGFDEIVGAIRAKGVEFLTFEFPGGTWTDGVADMPDGSRGVWFEDPDANIINIDTART